MIFFRGESFVHFQEISLEIFLPYGPITKTMETSHKIYKEIKNENKTKMICRYDRQVSFPKSGVNSLASFQESGFYEWMDE